MGYNVDKTKIPPGMSLTDCVYQMMSSKVMPIYDSPKEPSVAIDNVFYFKHIYKIQLLHQLGSVTSKEVARLVSMLDSPDEEAWVVAEQIIKEKFSQI